MKPGEADRILSRLLLAIVGGIVGSLLGLLLSERFGPGFALFGPFLCGVAGVVGGLVVGVLVTQKGRGVNRPPRRNSP
jgi:fluoride ion exporter CrcB/FEX